MFKEGAPNAGTLAYHFPMLVNASGDKKQE